MLSTMSALLLLSYIAVVIAAPTDHCDLSKVAINGGTYTVSNNGNISSKVIYKCPEGKYPHPVSSRECSSNGTWTKESERAECRDFLMFAIGNDNICKVGLPPSDYNDNFGARATVCGRMDNARLAAYSPNGQLYVIRGEALYRGDVPSSSTENWFSEAQLVGKTDWGQFKFIFFHPNGRLYAATHQGALYEGPAPDNVHESWLYRKAKKIGASGWNKYYALFFDNEGILYAVTSNELLKQRPPTDIDHQWQKTSTAIGHGKELSNFKGFDPQGNLWCVSKDKGKIFMGPPPTHAKDKWSARAKNLGYDYNKYKIILFVEDRFIKEIISLQFLIDSGKILSTSPEVVAEELYDNKGSSVSLASTFTVSKSFEATSSFSHDHGLLFGGSTELTIKSGIPIIFESIKVGIHISTSNTWSYSKGNTTKVEFFNQFHFQVPPGKAVRQTAIVQKADVEVPYNAKIRTFFGNEATISGKWKGVCYFNLRVTQVDV